MKKKIFFSKKFKYRYLIFFSSSFILILSYLIFFFININKSYFVIDNIISNYSIIPKDKEGKKINYLDKKSINNLLNIEKINLNNTEFLKFTLQLFSNTNYKEIKKYYNSFVFSIESDIGKDYFISYKNFSTKEEALNFCLKSSIVQNCLVINPNN